MRQNCASSADSVRQSRPDDQARFAPLSLAALLILLVAVVTCASPVIADTGATTTTSIEEDAYIDDDDKAGDDGSDRLVDNTPPLTNGELRPIGLDEESFLLGDWGDSKDEGED